MILFKDFMQRDISPLIQVEKKLFVMPNGEFENCYSYKIDYRVSTGIKVPDKFNNLYNRLDESGLFTEYHNWINNQEIKFLEEMNDDEKEEIKTLIFNKVLNMNFTHIFTIHESIAENIDDSKLYICYTIKGIKKLENE